MDKAKDLAKLMALKEGEECVINWHEGGGGLVTKRGALWDLEDVPQYGGIGYDEGSYSVEALDQLIEKAYTFN